MVRTQVYLTEDEQRQLKSLSAQMGKKQSVLIREALDKFLLSFSREERVNRLRKAKGVWKGRSKIEFVRLRKEVNREFHK